MSIKRVLEVIDCYDFVLFIMFEEVEKNIIVVVWDVDIGKNDINGMLDDEDVRNKSDINVEKLNEELIV